RALGEHRVRVPARVTDQLVERRVSPCAYAKIGCSRGSAGGDVIPREPPGDQRPFIRTSSSWGILDPATSDRGTQERRKGLQREAAAAAAGPCRRGVSIRTGGPGWR